MNNDLNDIREQLKEARRYTRTNWSVCREMVSEARDRLLAYGIERNNSDDMHARIMRLLDNLTIGVKYLPTCPRALEGYIDGAVLELGLEQRGEE